MPKLVRIMKRADDGFPLVASSSSALGVRPGMDIDVDPRGNALSNDKGMSVYSSWEDISPRRIPKRLGGQGANSTFVFVFGSGAFQQVVIADGLEFLPDTPPHGVVRPIMTVPLAQYEAALAATRGNWRVDET
ncbi:MAG: hypothetical protein HYR84_00690 [Planctomycetes bacterium]|nr:hypothetical protein [Planctomycetota bacterium]